MRGVYKASHSVSPEVCAAFISQVLSELCPFVVVYLYIL